MSEIVTPISDARNRYRKLRSKGRRMTPQERVWYYQFRFYLQRHTANWRRSRKAFLLEMAEDSLVATQATLREWIEFHNWLTAQEGQVAENNRRTFHLICGHVDDSVATVKDVVDDFADDESPLDTIVDSIAAAGSLIGLELYEPWADADDGAVWFINPETGNKHYFLLGQHHEGWKFEVMSRPIVNKQSDDRWKQFEAVDLSRDVLPWSTSTLHHPARWLDAYFGAYNGLGIVEKDLPESVDRALGKLRNITRRPA